ncbi:MAG TPA: SCO family protein [Methylomirabilota bacterium]|nr:SCO family protein [Methylomirabilota bacterium]
MSRAAAIAAALALGLAAAALAAGAEALLPRLGPAPNFALTTQQNDRLWLTQLRHRVVVLTFTCTACQACPGVLPFLSGLARDLRDAAGRAVFFVVVTVDPARDSAPVLRRFARDRRLDPVAWLLLTGKPSEIDVVTRWYGVAVHRQDGGVSHDCLVVLIDGGGTIRGRYGLDDLAQLRRGVDALRAEGTGS